MNVFPFLHFCELFSLLQYVAGAIGQEYNCNLKRNCAKFSSLGCHLHMGKLCEFRV